MEIEAIRAPPKEAPKAPVAGAAAAAPAAPVAETPEEDAKLKPEVAERVRKLYYGMATSLLTQPEANVCPLPELERERGTPFYHTSPPPLVQ